jgi:hypothetical protein
VRDADETDEADEGDRKGGDNERPAGLVAISEAGEDESRNYTKDIDWDCYSVSDARRHDWNKGTNSEVGHWLLYSLAG